MIQFFFPFPLFALYSDLGLHLTLWYEVSCFSWAFWDTRAKWNDNFTHVFRCFHLLYDFHNPFSIVFPWTSDLHAHSCASHIPLVQVIENVRIYCQTRVLWVVFWVLCFHNYWHCRLQLIRRHLLTMLVLVETSSWMKLNHLWVMVVQCMVVPCVPMAGCMEAWILMTWV